MAELLDWKVLLVIATARWWLPFARYIVAAVDPYPGLRDRRQRGRGATDAPRIEPLASEEWAVWRRRREEEERAARGGRPPVAPAGPRAGAPRRPRFRAVPGAAPMRRRA